VRSPALPGGWCSSDAEHASGAPFDGDESHVGRYEVELLGPAAAAGSGKAPPPRRRSWEAARWVAELRGGGMKGSACRLRAACCAVRRKGRSERCERPDLAAVQAHGGLRRQRGDDVDYFLAIHNCMHIIY
jgi:hypothetical protein